MAAKGLGRVEKVKSRQPCDGNPCVCFGTASGRNAKGGVSPLSAVRVASVALEIVRADRPAHIRPAPRPPVIDDAIRADDAFETVGLAHGRK